MKSICIKTNNGDSLDYLLKSFENLNQENVCFSCNEFKLYKNIIIHYTGNDVNTFCKNVADVLSFLVIDIFEENILKNLILNNYFYFDKQERNNILDICNELFLPENEFSLNNRKDLLFNSFYEYILDNNKIVLNGFINFRLKDYMHFLDNIVDTAVNKFIVEREYLEFISLLKLYVSSQPSCCDFVHLIYLDSQTILLDENKNIINTESDIFDAKYLSDISFSSNDFALNTLLNILPKKIYIHLAEKPADEFIDTLMQVFENRISLCNDCSICNLYRSSKFATPK